MADIADGQLAGEAPGHSNSPSVDPTLISLLGGFSVYVSGKLVRRGWRLNKAKTLVKLLALAPQRRLHRDQVVDILWPGAEMRAAANNFHQVVHAARSTLA